MERMKHDLNEEWDDINELIWVSGRGGMNGSADCCHGGRAGGAGRDLGYYACGVGVAPGRRGGCVPDRK